MNKLLAKALKGYEADIVSPEEAGKVDRLLLDSPRLNYIFGGGFPLGRIVELYGPESSGKSTLSWYIGGHFQRREKQNVVLLLDFERSYHKDYADTVGLSSDPNKLIIVRPLTGEAGFQICEDAISSGEVGLVILDSLAAIPAAKAVDADYGKGFTGPAALISSAFPKLNPYIDRYNTPLLVINQERVNIGGFSPVPGMIPKKTTGGEAPKYWASWRGRVSKSKDVTSKGAVVGNGIKIKNTKNKISVPKRVAEMELYYATGFDVLDEYVSFISDKEFNYAEVRGAWIYGLDGTPLEGLKFQGRVKLKEWLVENPSALELCKEGIVKQFETMLESDKHREAEDELTYAEDDWGDYSPPSLE